MTREAVQALAQVRERFEAATGGLRWSAAESWHVTLQCLGQASEEQADCVLKRLGTVEAAPVPVRIEGLGFFERAGVFWAGVALTPELLALEQKVVAATRKCGLVPEERAYHPHITLARAKGRGGAGALAPLKIAVERGKTALEAEFFAEEFLLYESIPGPEGSQYEVRGRFALRG
jgi:2'-5' RNA ligase